MLLLMNFLDSYLWRDSYNVPFSKLSHIEGGTVRGDETLRVGEAYKRESKRQIKSAKL